MVRILITQGWAKGIKVKTIGDVQALMCGYRVTPGTHHCLDIYSNAKATLCMFSNQEIRRFPAQEIIYKSFMFLTLCSTFVQFSGGRFGKFVFCKMI